MTEWPVCASGAAWSGAAGRGAGDKVAQKSPAVWQWGRAGGCAAAAMLRAAMKAVGMKVPHRNARSRAHASSGHADAGLSSRPRHRGRLRLLGAGAQ
jgi:hypothetical protein